MKNFSLNQIYKISKKYPNSIAVESSDKSFSYKDLLKWF